MLPYVSSLALGAVASTLAVGATGDPLLDAAVASAPNAVIAIVGLALFVQGRIVSGKKISEVETAAQKRHDDAETARQREVAALDLRAKAAEQERDLFRTELSTLQAWVRDQALPAINESNRLAAVQLEALARRQQS